MRYDAILKNLPEDYPQDWAQFAGVDRHVAVTIIDADVSTVSAAADKVLRIDEPEPWILHLEFQASHDSTLSERVLKYNVLLGIRHSLPVRSVVVLLRREADGKGMTGRVVLKLPRDRKYLEFEYDTIRLWDVRPETILDGGVGTLPLLPLTEVAEPELPAMINQMENRFLQEMGQADMDSLWTATFILMGLKYDPEVSSQLLQGVRSMKESVTYQAILKEGWEIGREVGREVGREEGLEAGLERGLRKGRVAGREEEARRILLAQGSKLFGKPSAKIRKAISNIVEPAVLEQLALRLLDAKNWSDLLDTP